MPKSAMIRARIDPKLKKQAEAVLKSLGLNASEAISIFYSQIRYKQGIPFEVKIPIKKAKYSQVSRTSRKALVKKAKLMTPEQRLEAFFNHSYLVGGINKSLPRERQT